MKKQEEAEVGGVCMCVKEGGGAKRFAIPQVVNKYRLSFRIKVVLRVFVSRL